MATVIVLVRVLLTCVLVTARSKKKNDAYNGEVQEDPVQHVASQWRKQGRLGQAPDIPALTDRTFPATVYDSGQGQGHGQLVVVLFYLPFDELGMLFLQQYQQAGRELSLAAGKAGDSSPSSSPSSRRHPLRRVNCYDWTDVCRKENVTRYPTIHLYQEGKWRQRYQDALDKDVLVRTVSLLLTGQPVWLRTEEEVERFVHGSLLDNVHPSVNSLVLLKPSPSLSEVAAFTQVVRELETQMLFAIVRPEVNAHIGVEVGVLHVRKDDKYRPYDTLTSDLDAESIRRFLVSGKLGLLPELSFLNFPELYARRQPLAILFLRTWEAEAAMHVQAVADVIRSGSVDNVTFCTMAVDDDNSMADALLRTYTGQRAVPAFVFVDLHKGTVFAFSMWPLTERKLRVWISGAQDSKIPPTKQLDQGQWRPTGHHTDFLTKMDRDRERKEKNRGYQPPQDQNDDVSDDDISALSDTKGRLQLRTARDDDRENSEQHNHNQVLYEHERGLNQNHRKHPELDRIREHRHGKNKNQDTHHRNQQPRNHDQDRLNRGEQRPNLNQHQGKQNQHNPNRNQQNHRHHNLKQHGVIQNEQKQKANKNDHDPNWHTLHRDREVKEKNKLVRRFSLDDSVELESEKQQKPPQASGAGKKTSRTQSSKHTAETLGPERGDKKAEDDRSLHTEL